jgi:DNA excision repair protein ERCC-3
MDETEAEGDGDAAESPGEEGNGPPDDLDPEQREERTTAFYDALESVGRPVATAGEVARRTDLSHDGADDLLAALPDANRLDVSNDPVVWYPEDLETLTDRERVVVFPDRREVVVDQPDQYTLAQLSGFARLVTTSGEGSYIYEVRDADVWAAPHEDLGELVAAMRSVLGRWERLEEWVRAQYERTRKFRLRTDGDDEGYTVLEAASEDLMGNVARQQLDDDLLRGLVSDTEAWVVEGEEAVIKRQLYDAGYPVRDDRDLEDGDALALDLEPELRDYQRDWVDRFVERGAGVLVGPPGSGKTVAAMGIMAAVEGETLVLVPSRELAGQWYDELLSKTTLSPGEVGEYHGGTKEMAPVTIATYQTAGMDRHRELFDARRWGLIVYDEVQHVPAPIARRSVELQSKSRLGLSVDGDTVIPVRRDGIVETTTIEEFVSKYLGDEAGIASVTDAETLGITDEREVVWTDVTGAMRHENTSDRYTVRASNGRQVTVTEDHSLIAFDGDETEVVERTPQELGDTDYLLQPATLPEVNGAQSTFDVMGALDEGHVLVDEDAPVSVFDPLYEEGIGSNENRYDWKTRQSLPLSVAREIGLDREHVRGVYVRKRDQYLPPDVDIEDFARLAGLFVADGNVDGHRIDLYAADSDTNSEVEEFRSIVRAVAPEADVHTTENGENCTTVRVSGPLAPLFENVGLAGTAREKSVPSFVLSNPLARVTFLEGIVLGDGYRQKRDRGKETVTISTSSDELAQGLNLVLASLGHVGGNYRREPDVAVREGDHDTVTNNSVRYDPKNRRKTPRKAMTPFTEELREPYQSIERNESRVYSADGGALRSGLEHRSRLSSDELQTMLFRSDDDDHRWLREPDVAMLEVDSVTPADDQDREHVYDVSTGTENFLGNGLFCHNSATPVREDDKESEIFTLVGPPIGTDWTALFEAGYVARPEVEIRYVPWDPEARDEYAATSGHGKRQVAASNPAKRQAVENLLDETAGKALVFVDYLDQGEAIAAALGVPFVSGETRHARRAKLLSELRRGERDLLVVSRVADEGIDLPDVETAIVASGLGGSRRQGTQRAGRTMRPMGTARMYVLATRGTEEEEFARQRTRHLASKGVRVRETEADVEVGDASGDEGVTVDATDDAPTTAGETGTDEDD